MSGNTKCVGTLPEYEEARPSIRAALGALEGAAEALAVLTDKVGDRSALGAFLVPEHGTEGGRAGPVLPRRGVRGVREGPP